MGGRYDIAELLARTDLAQLADELLGGHRGNGTTARWPSPTPGHPQTGRTPPMTIRIGPDGRERFHCWATGATGTAIDLIALVRSVDIPTALNALADRVGSSAHSVVHRAPAPTAALAGRPDPAIATYVAMGERWLWTPAGRGPLRYLTEQRGLDTDVLRANRVGFDPGPRLEPRHAGLPHGPGIILPTFDQNHRLVYVQTRNLRPDAIRKYVNPTGQLAANPSLSWPIPIRMTRPDDLVICEGLIDALTIAGAGHRAVAVLGVGHSGAAVAQALATRRERLVLAFDGDAAGNRARVILTDLLGQAGRSVAVWPVPIGHDINSTLRQSNRGPPPARTTPSRQPSQTMAPGM